MILYIQVSQVEFLFRACQTHFLDADETDLAVFEWYFLELLFSPKLEEEFSKVDDVFRFLLQVFPLFRLRKIKNRLRVFIFCEGDFFFNVRKLMSLIARVLQLFDFQALPVQWQAKMPCHWCHFCNRVTSVTCEKQAHCTGNHWYSAVYDIRAMSAMGLRK